MPFSNHNVGKELWLLHSARANGVVRKWGRTDLTGF